ncbi:MAG TPA: hypothetical protein VF905_06930 [Nitrospirota bacterium]
MPTPSFPTKTLLMHACLGAALVMTGCSSTSKIAQNAKGSVYLEEVTDWSFDASHPAVIDQLTIMKIVKGVYGDGSSKMSAGGSKPMRVFSDEDAEFLAPLLAQGLSKAKPEQLVGFRVSSSAGSGSEPTAGSIYVQQGSIHFTISKGAGSTTFTPESAARTEYAPSYAAGGMTGVTAHVIDIHALAKAPMPAAMPVVKTSPKAAPTTSASLVDENQFQQREIDQLSKAKETIAKKDTEISVLRKESEWMKRELRDRDEELKALKASVKQVPKKKRAEAQPTR